MSKKSKYSAFEKISMHANQRDEKINWGEVIGTFLGAIIVVGLLYIAGNLLLGLD